MSDGGSDMVEHFNESLDQFVKAYMEFFREPNDLDEGLLIELIHKRGEEVSKIPRNFLRDNLHLPEYLINRINNSGSSYVPTQWEFYFLLLALRRYNDLICLHKYSMHFDNLVILTDANWQVAKHGVLYRIGAKFVDGDQDILLGIAKKRHLHQPMFFTDSLLHQGVPIFIVASWRTDRKRWHLSYVWQPL